MKKVMYRTAAWRMHAVKNYVKRRFHHVILIWSCTACIDSPCTTTDGRSFFSVTQSSSAEEGKKCIESTVCFKKGWPLVKGDFKSHSPHLSWAGEKIRKLKTIHASQENSHDSNRKCKPMFTVIKRHKHRKNNKSCVKENFLDRCYAQFFCKHLIAFSNLQNWHDVCGYQMYSTDKQKKRIAIWSLLILASISYSSFFQSSCWNYSLLV